MITAIALAVGILVALAHGFFDWPTGIKNRLLVIGLSVLTLSIGVAASSLRSITTFFLTFAASPFLIVGIIVWAFTLVIVGEALRWLVDTRLLNRNDEPDTTSDSEFDF